MTLDEAVARAFAGDARELYALLARGSGLPGTRANIPLAQAVAAVCASDPRGPALATSLASLSADEAPGGTALEILPLTGVLAASACATRQRASRDAMLQVIHDACDDLRFRVRDVVPMALVAIGTREGPKLLEDLEPFLEGYFHAASVLIALTNQDWLGKLSDGAPVAEALKRAFDLADAASRAAERYPGYKALVDAIEKSIAPLALRFGEPVLTVVAGFARTRNPHLRSMVVRALADKKIRARLPAELLVAEKALAAATPAPRDPRSASGPTRKRGGGRRR